ncbi:unnamed protein product, partial [Closterium sp. NIES-54]
VTQAAVDAGDASVSLRLQQRRQDGTAAALRRRRLLHLRRAPLRRLRLCARGYLLLRLGLFLLGA